MANHDEILLRTELPPDRVARRLAEILHAILRQESDAWVVYRQLRDREGTIGGPVMRNRLRHDQLKRGEESVYDAYDIIFEIWATYQHETTQRREAQVMFSEIVENLQWPAVHADEGGVLFSAWDPELGRTDFPEDTGVYVDDREFWLPYVEPGLPG
ncbi:MAG TPA: hypothetical protein VHJ83_17150 [Micromonosporaceae bacterium]|jgi:hypothetical protein|nr:hypothetical protein [Micromonosporaceae bacterium]